MTEISSVSESYFEEMQLPLEPQDPPWKKIGKVSLFCFSLLAFSAFVPAAMKKKRTYISLPSAAAMPIIPAMETAVDVPEVRSPSATPALPAAPVPSCSPEDAEAIKDLFKTVAESSVWRLGIIGYNLQQIGNQLRRNNVHPFELLKRARKEDMQAIFRGGNPLKIFTTMRGIEEGMERERGRNNIDRYIPAFAADMGKAAEEMRLFIQARDWRGLVYFLYDISS